ncbi:S-layer homology domain-containing protein [Thiolapillus brandeum]|uniref:SLH domain-containing protein n=1 Tax=Thiolapillus brandeum TaxID=1076588 RepID=A0A7U6GL88_9GAMM|nr:S-layer homology domain-containing protein [Thiolapillus brandeum]BAO45648.1 hypothetical protein TBH_C2746 [Thiolapillus brandeum]
MKQTQLKKRLLPVLMATAIGNGSAWANAPLSPDYAAFVEAAAYVCTGTLFNDVPASHWACGYIEEFANLDITSGCGANNYCPGDNVTRAEVAVFFVKGLEETLYDQLDGSGSGLDADLLDGQDSSYYLDWDNFVGIPADLLDGDSDTLAGLTCASGEVAKWSGSAWACAVDDTGSGGDITAVNAGTGLSGGGTTGDVTLSADTSYLQRRVSSSCTAGSSIRAIAADGSVTCETDDDTGGDITAVNAGTGLSGGGASGDVTLSADISYLQRRVSSSCTAGSSIRAIAADGTVTCEADDNAGGDITAVNVGAGLSGGGASGDVTLSADTTYLQRRVSSSCTAGSSIRAIAADGTVTCETDDDAGGDITAVNAGTGLSGGGGTGDVSLNVAVPLALSGAASGGILKGTNTDTGSSSYGVEGVGQAAGGYFKDSNDSGVAYVGYGDEGIFAIGNTWGGKFRDGNNSGYAHVGYGDLGIAAYGNTAGGYFQDSNSSGWAQVGTGAAKIIGSGAVSFVQNHPENPDEVIVYASPEGDEVATYTRGSARLVNGEARIPLGETFKWVTNPDIGLTAHLTPIGEPCVLYVAETSTSELLVKGGQSCSQGARFNYIVYGLRIGFEDVTVVQKKTREARIPSMADHRKAIEAHPELARYTALSRYARMQGSTREAVKTQMVRAAALLDKIEEFDPAVHRIETPAMQE